MPALEAMACECPCMVSRAGSLPEVCGDAALYVDPYDRASIAAGIQRIATDPALRASLVEKGRARARQFSWDRCAMQTSELLAQAFDSLRMRDSAAVHYRAVVKAWARADPVYHARRDRARAALARNSS